MVRICILSQIIFWFGLTEKYVPAYIWNFLLSNFGASSYFSGSLNQKNCVVLEYKSAPHIKSLGVSKIPYVWWSWIFAWKTKLSHKNILVLMQLSKSATVLGANTLERNCPRLFVFRCDCPRMLVQFVNVSNSNAVAHNWVQRSNTHVSSNFLGTKLVEFSREKSCKCSGKIHLHLCHTNFMGSWSQKRPRIQSYLW